MLTYKEFFEKYGHTETPTIEETYRAFKERLRDENKDEMLLDELRCKINLKGVL